MTTLDYMLENTASPTSPNVAMEMSDENSSVKYLGFVEVNNNKILSGWSLKIVGNRASPTHVFVQIGKNKYRVPANGFRQDLFDRIKADFGNFSLDLSTLNGAIPYVTFEDGTEVPKIPEPSQVVKYTIENDYDAFLNGWAASEKNIAPRIHLFCNGELAQETYATGFRSDLAEANINKGYATFHCRIPAKFRGIPGILTRVEADGVEIYSTTRFYSPLSVLIVSETENLEDASRYYRCNNLRNLLQNESIEANVIGIAEFNAKVWIHVDVIVFARCGASLDMFNKVKEYKEQYGIKIIYEIDDLVFLPWHTHDLGSVRSGVDDATNQNLIDMFARRLRLITLADGAITTTKKIASHFDAMGIPCKKIPNMLRPHEITQREHHPVGILRILCMSGSATHYKDFEDIEQVLVKFLRRHKASVELTLLGHFREGLHLLDLPNVKHFPRVPYPKMLLMIDKSDLCIAPLEYTEFNDAKSCLKYIECGARGVPVLASATSDYSDAITNKVNGFIAEDLSDWTEILEACAAGEHDLHKIGLTAQKDVAQKFNIEKAKFNLRQFMQEI